MALDKEVLGNLSIGFAVSGVVVPIGLGFVTSAMGIERSISPSIGGFLFLLLQGTALACARSAGKIQTARIGFGISLASLALLVFLGIGQYRHQHGEPEERALAYYRGLHDQNWRLLWDLTDFTPMEARVWRTPEIYERDMRQNVEASGAAQGYGYFTQLRNIAVGNASVNGIEANVPTSATLPYSGRVLHLHGQMHLRDEGGVWKVLIRQNDQDDPARSLCEILGVPYHPEQR